jgi:hypothetical protein
LEGEAGGGGCGDEEEVVEADGEAHEDVLDFGEAFIDWVGFFRTFLFAWSVGWEDMMARMAAE